MYRTALSVLSLVAACGVARADVIDQTFNYSWTSADPRLAEFSFQPFDSMGGTRILTGVRLGFEGTIAMEITARTYDPVPLFAGEWSAEASHSVISYFNEIEVFQGLGGQWMDGITGDLGAGSGGFPFGDPGTPYVVSDSVFHSLTVELDSSVFADFSGTDPLVGFMDAFTDTVVTPPNSGQYVEVFASMLAQDGALTLTYEYTTVPAPAGLAMLGVCGLAGMRRRRG